MELIYLCEIQFENEDFWIACIKQSAVKRMIDLGFNDADLISNAVKLETDEIEKLINLKKSFIFYLDKKFRFNFVNYYSSNKYVGFAIKRFIGLNDGDVFEFDFSKSLEFPEYEEYDLEFKAISDGKDLAHNLALLKLFNLKYSRQDISTILGSDDVKKFDKDGIVDTGYLDDMIKIHSKNKGIRYKQREILFNLLDFENNIENASEIIGWGVDEVEKFIDDNSMFKSQNQSRILDKNKLYGELDKWKIQALAESFTLGEVHDYSLEEYSEVTDFDIKFIKKFFKCHEKFKENLLNELRQIAYILSEMNFDFNQIMIITGLREDEFKVSGNYYYEKYIEELSSECGV